MQIIFLADELSYSPDVSALHRSYEKTYLQTIQEMNDALKKLSPDVIQISDLKKLPSILSTSNPDTAIGFSVWAGSVSRNRKALVPALFETFDINYIGPDAYTALMTADKHVAKIFLKHYGFNVPAGVVIRDKSRDIHLCKHVGLPAVVKPLYEGGSIGISSKNLVRDRTHLHETVDWIIGNFDQPALVETFVPGREVSLCIIGNHVHQYYGASEVAIKDDPNFFDHSLFSIEKKRLPGAREARTQKNITNQILNDLWEKSQNVFLGLGKVNYLRIDGKLSGDKFTCIELSADPGLGPSSLFYTAFDHDTTSYTSFLKRLLEIGTE